MAEEFPELQKVTADSSPLGTVRTKTVNDVEQYAVVVHVLEWLPEDEDIGAAKWLDFDDWFDLPDGHRLVSVDVEFFGLELGSYQVDELDWMLHMADNTRVRPFDSWDGRSRVPVLLSVGLPPPGDRIRGWVTFGVPEHAQPIFILHTDGDLVARWRLT